MMKLLPKVVGHSSVVGGGLMLCDESGACRFVVNIIGSTQGITREQSESIATQLSKAVRDAGGIIVGEDS